MTKPQTFARPAGNGGARVIQASFRGGHPPAALVAQARQRGMLRPLAAPARPFSAQDPAALHAIALPLHAWSAAAPAGGQPLPAAIQRKMEARFGGDLSDVRIHVGLAPLSIGALAFTSGTDIHFAPGQYRPWTKPGEDLLAEQLDRVRQQRSGEVHNPFGRGVAVVSALHDLAEAPAGPAGAGAHLATLQASKKKKKIKSKWSDWPTIRGHFALYGADKDSIAWLQVAEKAGAAFPPEVGHASSKSGKDKFAEHVLGALRDYIAWLKESLQMTDSHKNAGKLSYWKSKYNIA